MTVVEGKWIVWRNKGDGVNGKDSKERGGFSKKWVLKGQAGGV